MPPSREYPLCRRVYKYATHRAESGRDSGRVVGQVEILRKGRDFQRSFLFQYVDRARRAEMKPGKPLARCVDKVELALGNAGVGDDVRNFQYAVGSLHRTIAERYFPGDVNATGGIAGHRRDALDTSIKSDAARNIDPLEFCGSGFGQRADERPINRQIGGDRQVGQKILHVAARVADHAIEPNDARAIPAATDGHAIDGRLLRAERKRAACVGE